MTDASMPLRQATTDGAGAIIPVPELRSERLLLRQWREDDLEPFAALNADPRVMEFFVSRLSRAQSEAMVERIRRHFVERGFGLWAVEVPGLAPFAGFVGLKYPHLPAPLVPAVEVGWRLAFEHWGHGYATEAARAVLAAGFNRLGLDEIVSITTTTNVRSRQVMEKLGLRHAPADDFDHPSIAEGHPFRRHVLYRLSRIEWAKHAASTGR